MKTSPAKCVQNSVLPEVLEPLSSTEQRDFERIESVIAAKLAAFFEVGFALMQIKQRRLYRAEFQTFEEYCRKRWEFNRAHAYRLIAAAEVYETLSPMGDIPLPQNERQVRALEGLPSKTIKKAWRTAYEKAGKHGRITGALVQKAVSEVMEGRKDSNHESFRTNWQIHVTSLLKEALNLTCKGDQDAVADKIDRIALLLMVGRRPGERDPAD